MRILKTCYQQGEKFDEKTKKGTKMTRFPAPGFEPCNMVRSDALPTELWGTCRQLKLNFKVMF